jgi:hypothetical protein
MNIGSPVILGWETFSEDEAVDAAIDEFGRDPTTSVVSTVFIPSPPARQNERMVADRPTEGSKLDADPPV